MKKLTVYGLTLLLCTAATGAVAGDRGHGKDHGDRHYKKKGHHYEHRDYGSRRDHHYKPYRYQRHSGSHYRHDNYYPSYLGAVLIGSALTYSFYHNHEGTYCYEDHASDRYRPRSGGYSEVVGCHRIERLPDGRERRVEVPMSQCR